MTTHPGDNRLNDYVDGELDGRDTAEVREHLAACATCRAEVERLRRLVQAAATLEDSVAPPRELWSGISRRIDAAQSVDLDGWRDRARSRIWRHRYQLVAAATLLVLTASTGTLLLLRQEPARTPAVTAKAPVPGTVRLVSVPGHSDYVQAIGELDALLRERAGQLDPQTLQVVEHNLAIIDQAIRETQRALATDPASAELNRAVSTAYKTKINLLRRAVELPART